MKPNISIIIPVYNAEAYIHKCVESILNQSYKSFEIILINDGSTDNSGSICDEYAKKDNRIIVQHKVNGGVSSARNKGIDMASGEYILFVDSDDWIEPNALEILLTHINMNNSDVIIFSLVTDLFSNDKLIKSYTKGFYKKHEISVQELRSNFLYYLNSSGLHPSWMYLFKGNIITNERLYFNNNLVLYEDFDFNLRYLKYCNKISFIPEVLYHYNVNASINQLEKRNKFNIVSDINTVCRSLFDFLKYTGNNNSVSKQTYAYVLPMYNLCLRKIVIHRRETSYKEKFNILSQLRNDKIFRELIDKYAITLRFYRLLNNLVNRQFYLLAYYLLLFKFNEE